MNFTVYWRPAAEAQLRRIWRDAANVEAVADAADAVNRILRDAAHEQGNRETGRRFASGSTRRSACTSRSTRPPKMCS